MKHEGLLCAAHKIACEAAGLAFAEEMPAIFEACQKRVEAGSLWDDTYPLKLLELRAMLRAWKPRTVVEIGSGATTLVLRDNCPNVLSIDDKDWGGTATRVVDGNFVRFAETVEMVQNAPDLLYVDGPNSNNGSSEKPLVSADAADLIRAGVFPRVIAFDMRHASVQHTFEVAGKAYSLVPNYLISESAGIPWYVASLKIHSLLVRVK